MPNNLHALYAHPADALSHAQGRSYGWHRSERPTLHARYQMPAFHAAGHLPASVDLTPGCPAVYDQGSLGSCTANALAALFQFLLMKEGKPAFVPSRLMIYWGERAMEGTKDEDAGANGDDGVTFLQTKGVCPEATWPYDPSRFAEMPPSRAWAEAIHHKVAHPVALDNTSLAEVRSCLATGYPVAFGFHAYPGLEAESTAKTGLLPMPGKDEQSIGGHAVLLVGYDDASKRFKVRNSWGPGWGLDGYFFMPYAYATDPKLAADFRSAKLAS